MQVIVLLACILPCIAGFVLSIDQGIKLVEQLKDYTVLQTNHVNRLLSIQENESSFEHELYINNDISYILQLKPLKIHHDAFQSILIDAEGNQKIEMVKESDLNCLYHGSIMGKSNSRVLMSTCGGGIHAHIQEDKQESHIQTVYNENGEPKSIYFRKLDVKEPFSGTCGNFNHEKEKKVHIENPSAEHSTVQQQMTSMPIPSKNRKLEATQLNMELIIVNSASRYHQHGSNVLSQTILIAALVQEMYTELADTFGDTMLTLTVTKMVSFVDSDPESWYDEIDHQSPLELDGKVHADYLLTNFGRWSEKHLVDYDVVHLLHGTDFYTTTDTGEQIDGVVGLANTGKACDFNSENTPIFETRSAITQATSLINQEIANTMAHEIGHNIGMRHANEEGCNDNEGYIMNSVTKTISNLSWSPCSNAALIEFLNENPNQKDCLSGGNTTPEAKGVCGNGIVEEGEECDCPLGDCSEAGDSCCNGTTCRLIGNAQCSALEPCCTDTCEFVEANTMICRESRDPFCDAEEMCSGTSGACPGDVTRANGTPCDDGPSKNTNYQHYQSGACFHGECIGRNQQCIEFVESTDQHPDHQTAVTAECGSIKCINNALNVLTLESRLWAQGTPCCENDDLNCDLQKEVDVEDRKICYMDGLSSYCIKSKEIPVDESCKNGIQDNFETDVDCGGPDCFACAEAEACLTDFDCQYPAFCNQVKTDVMYNNTICTLPLDESSCTIFKFDCPKFVENVASWVQENPTTASIIGGGAALIFVSICIFCCCCKSSKKVAQRRSRDMYKV